MNFIKEPNLPSRTVKYVICDQRIDTLITDELSKLGVKAIYVPKSPILQEPVSSHPDMNVFYFGNGNFCTSQEYCEIFTKQIKGVLPDCDFFNNAPIKQKLKKAYPHDVLLNAAAVGEYIICNHKTVAKEIIEKTSKEIISVKQGYTKCSTCIVSDSAIITDDPSIANAVKSKLDVLYVENSAIRLDGYNCGFIGGCSGKLSADTLAFSGNLERSQYGNDIKAFCKNHYVYCLSLSDNSLYDYGSILPIIEE